YAAYFEWRGGRYRYDAAEDAAGRRKAVRQKQHLVWAVELQQLHASRGGAPARGAQRDPAAAEKAAAGEAAALRLSPAREVAASGLEDERILKEQEKARDAASDIAELSKPGRLSKVADWMPAIDTMLAERHLEALLGHVYAASAGNPDDLYYENPDFVRRHSFRTSEHAGQTMESAFSKTVLVTGPEGKGAKISGSLFGLPDVLGLLHADQLAYAPGAGVPSEEVRAGLVAPIWRVEVARSDDDALEAVAASCRAAEELAPVVAARPTAERFGDWDALARDLAPRSRLGLIASLDSNSAAEAAEIYPKPPHPPPNRRPTAQLA